MFAHRVWHTLRVEFAGRRMSVALDGKRYIELDDDRIAGPGAVGVWTKADSVTAFDDFAYGATRALNPENPSNKSTSRWRDRRTTGSRVTRVLSEAVSQWTTREHRRH